MTFLNVLWVVAWGISFFCIFWIVLALCIGGGEIMRDFDRKRHELFYYALTFIVLLLAFYGWLYFSPVTVNSDNDLVFKWSIKSTEVIENE